MSCSRYETNWGLVIVLVAFIVLLMVVAASGQEQGQEIKDSNGNTFFGNVYHNDTLTEEEKEKLKQVLEAIEQALERVVNETKTNSTN